MLEGGFSLVGCALVTLGGFFFGIGFAIAQKLIGFFK